MVDLYLERADVAFRIGTLTDSGLVATGRLISVLPDAGDAEGIHALHLGLQRTPARIRAFLDYMVPRLRQAIGRPSA